MDLLAVVRLDGSQFREQKQSERDFGNAVSRCGSAVPIAVHEPEPFLEKTVIWFPRAHRIEWQESLAARCSMNSGLTADAANECAPPLGAGMILRDD